MKRTILFGPSNDAVNDGNGYYPADIARLYQIPTDLDGEGQTIGILEFSNGYSLQDAYQFWSLHNIPTPAVHFRSVDGTRNDGGTSPDDEEASLDLQWAGALAPKATLVVYEANGGSTFAEFAQALVRSLEFVLKDTAFQPSVLSISYGDAESNLGESAMQQIDALIQKLNAKGVTVCIASGDQGAYGMHDLSGPKVAHADGPATSPSAVAVGGTSLQPDGTETAWTYNGPDNGGATGGGFSTIFPKPDYQSNIAGSGRGIPDVALNADPATGYQIVFQGRPAIVGGTSVACPVFAAMVALANQRRAQAGLPALSDLPGRLYSTGLQSAFRDITSGNNTFNGVTGYTAVKGWDACTGWGAPIAGSLIEALASNAAASASSDS
ncbi:S53 family peptidase [Alicyclobacillus cycloheptanicus]|uniref:Kumamolisin n=1 Tax=Alicyclobacillus cycloheptanicus TaxID=1457 RepID=A0ABT9XFQ4_9BACL|nr:S53 family peptidase [Alicyclobacillus cycloheptanicus]MDQ0189127.1 kumamolisin [Alicyclobacillus cycloheptanicus]WDM00255.1 S53 family peptidase [Alicyclobacillus cycloheptanicus]